MDAIMNYVKDPAWWFSAFFVAIVASVIAGYAKDRIDQWLGIFSEKTRTRQKKKAEQRAEAVSALARNEGFLIMSLVRSAVLTLMTLAIMTLFVLSPMWSELVKTWCFGGSFDPTCKADTRFLSLLAFFGFGILSIICGYKSSSVARVVMLGYQAYRKERKLPSIL